MYDIEREKKEEALFQEKDRIRQLLYRIKEKELAYLMVSNDIQTYLSDRINDIELEEEEL